MIGADSARDEKFIQAVLDDPQATQKLLLAILKSLTLFYSEFHRETIYFPQRVTLAAGLSQRFERSAPGTSWLISVEQSPAGALVNVHWSEAPGMLLVAQLANGDTVRLPANFPHLLLENVGEVEAAFSVVETVRGLDVFSPSVYFQRGGASAAAETPVVPPEDVPGATYFPPRYFAPRYFATRYF